MNKKREVKFVRDSLLADLKGLYPDNEARSMIDELLLLYAGVDSREVIVNPDKVISTRQMSQLLHALGQLKEEKPLQYITGRAAFYGLNLNVDERVLIPRPETEELVKWIIEDNKLSGEISILDIGTGSGCIALALKKELEHARVFAIDHSTAAITVSKLNAEKHYLDISFMTADVFSSKDIFPSVQFDIIVSNPPYVTESDKANIRRNVKDYEPVDALFVPDSDPLKYYHVIGDFACVRLTSNGLLYLEINEAFGVQCINLLRDKGFEDVILRKDMQGKDRMIRASNRGRF